MNAKNPNTIKKILFALGIPLSIIVAMLIYVFFEKPICQDKYALSHAFCQLEVTGVATIIGIFGVIFMIVNLVRLSKESKSPYNYPKKEHATLKSSLKALLWTILIVAFLICIFGATAGGTNEAHVGFVVISVLLLIAMICLIVYDVHKQK